jgi:hypothetical protein
MTIGLILLAIVAMYTKVVFFEILLYVFICIFTLIHCGSLLMNKEHIFKGYDRVISKTVDINNNAAIVNIMIVFIPLGIGQWWALAAMWVIGNLIQHNTLLKYMEYRKGNGTT